MNSRKALLSAINGKNQNFTPVWFMRQAGRLFPEYRKLRDEYHFKELCQSNKLNTKVTCMPVERLDVDAAIIFSDILLPLESIGSGFRLDPEKGPQLDKTVSEPEDIKTFELGSVADDLDYIFEAIERSKSRLPTDVPLIGFAGAPFTLASYLIEGGRSRSLMKTRKFMLREPKSWQKLMELLVELTISYLRKQVEAGAEVLQLFDSWIGQISPGLYRQQVFPQTRRIFESLSDVPMIHFGTRTAGLLNEIEDYAPDVISLDWRIDMEVGRNLISDDISLQGNLDPALFLNSFDSIRSHIDRVLNSTANHRHIFNLGHGILPDTEPDLVRKVVEYVHSETQ